MCLADKFAKNTTKIRGRDSNLALKLLILFNILNRFFAATHSF